MFLGQSQMQSDLKAPESYVSEAFVCYKNQYVPAQVRLFFYLFSNSHPTQTPNMRLDYLSRLLFR